MFDWRRANRDKIKTAVKNSHGNPRFKQYPTEKILKPLFRGTNICADAHVFRNGPNLKKNVNFWRKTLLRKAHVAYLALRK